MIFWFRLCFYFSAYPTFQFYIHVWAICSVLCFMQFSHINALIAQILSVQQLYRICTQYWDDNYNTRSVSRGVSVYIISFFYWWCFWIYIPYQLDLNDQWLHSWFLFRSFLAWGYLWQKTPTVLLAIPFCWMTIPGESFFNILAT